MKTDGMKPDTATLNAFIQGLCAMGSTTDEFTSSTSAKTGSGRRVTDALLVLRAMRREQIEPDDYTYSILFAALGGCLNDGYRVSFLSSSYYGPLTDWFLFSSYNGPLSSS